MRLLLDTVAFLWALDDPRRLSGPARSALANTKAVREISSLSLSEIAIKVALGKLKLQKVDVMDGLSDLRLRVLLTPPSMLTAFLAFPLTTMIPSTVRLSLRPSPRMSRL